MILKTRGKNYKKNWIRLILKYPNEEIEVNVEEHFPLLKPIVSINRWQEDTGRNREIAKVIKSVNSYLFDVFNYKGDKHMIINN